MATGAPYFPVFQPNRWRKGSHGSKRAIVFEERGGIVDSDRMVALVIAMADQRPGTEACCEVLRRTSNILSQDTVVAPKARDRIRV